MGWARPWCCLACATIWNSAIQSNGKPNASKKSPSKPTLSCERGKRLANRTQEGRTIVREPETVHGHFRHEARPTRLIFKSEISDFKFEILNAKAQDGW